MFENLLLPTINVTIAIALLWIFVRQGTVSHRPIIRLTRTINYQSASIEFQLPDELTLDESYALASKIVEDQLTGAVRFTKQDYRIIELYLGGDYIPMVKR